MTETNVGIWLVVGFAVLGLLVAVPAISAHGNDTVLDNETTTDGTSQDGERIAWMAEHVTSDMGVNASEWMTTHEGVNNSEWTDSENGSLGPIAHAPIDNGDVQHDEYQDRPGNDHDERDDRQGHGGMHSGGHGC